MVATFSPAGVKFDRSGLAQLYGRRGAVGRHEVAAAKIILGAARRDVGVASGALRSALQVRASTKDVEVGAFEGGTGYALFHHTGTKAHPIDPRAGTYLVWRSSSGQTIFARHVDHPGTRPNPYLTGPARRLGAQVKER